MYTSPHPHAYRINYFLGREESLPVNLIPPSNCILPPTLIVDLHFQPSSEINVLYGSVSAKREGVVSITSFFFLDHAVLERLSDIPLDSSLWCSKHPLFFALSMVGTGMVMGFILPVHIAVLALWFLLAEAAAGYSRLIKYLMV